MTRSIKKKIEDHQNRNIQSQNKCVKIEIIKNAYLIKRKSNIYIKETKLIIIFHIPKGICKNNRF